MPGSSLEWSHGRVRVATRADEVTPIPSADTAPIQDPETGRFVPGNRAHRLRVLKARAEGIATLNPATCPTWLRPFVELGKPYVTALVAMLDGKPALHPLAGSVADSHCMFRALTSLALAAEGRDRTALLSEARGWLREHRTSLATLCALAGDIHAPTPPDADPLAAFREDADDDEPTPDPEPATEPNEAPDA